MQSLTTVFSNGPFEAPLLPNKQLSIVAPLPQFHVFSVLLFHRSSGVPTSLAGDPKVGVTFNVDCNGTRNPNKSTSSGHQERWSFLVALSTG